MTAKFIIRSLVVAVVLVASSLAFAQEQWRYTAMGDSLATGYSSPSGGYVPRYQSHIEADTGVDVTLYNLGQNGWTSGRLLAALQTDTVFQTSVNQSEVVTWNIGINDLMNARNSYKKKKCGGTDNQDCLRNLIASFESNWSNISNQILLMRSTATTIVRTMDIYNPWVKADKLKNTIADNKEPVQSRGNDFQVLKYYLDRMNGHITTTATNNATPCAQVYVLFNGVNGEDDPIVKGYIASDGLHPSNTGYQAIADEMRTLGYVPLR